MVGPLGWAALAALAMIAIAWIARHGIGRITPSLAANEIIATMRDLLLVTDREGRIQFANAAACSFLGYDREEISGRLLDELVVPVDDTEPSLHGRWVRDRECVIRTAMGQPIELTLSHSPVRRHGEITGAVIIGRDLRERKRYEWEARRAITLLQSTLDSTADGILVIGHEDRVLSWNRRFAEIWRIPAAVMQNDEDHELIARLVEQLADPRDFLESLEALRKHPEEESVHVLELIDGRRIEQYSIGRYLDLLPLRVWSFRDVTARLAAEEQIEFHAYHDALTHLPNRRMFVERLEMSLLAAKRTRGNVAVLFIDVDRFKNINDTHGHGVADALLVEVAQRLRSCVRQTDTVARYGGDEFTLILPDLHQPEDAAQVAEKILERFAEPVAAGAASIDLSVSIGVAVHPDDGDDFDALLRNADDAMYRAKHAGRNGYQLCTEQMKTRAAERASMQARLKKAMDEGELALVYQPQVAVRGGALAGAEAQVRWGDLAEETQFSVSLGEWMLAGACRQMRLWRDARLPPLRVGVRVSMRQFQQRDLDRTVRRAIEEHGIDPALLELEIREATAVRDLDVTAQRLHRLRDIGVSIAIHDFSSHASLRALQLLPIDAVRIAVGESVIAGAIMDVCRAAGLRITADGVETSEELELLARRGCHEAQGPYVGAALDPGDLELVMRDATLLRA
jgi:diguanylate cyclase (GGDEF)-like protein/PAS domain S-box-containing protein